MTLTIEQKLEAVAEAYTKRLKARAHYAELADAGDEDAQRKLPRIERDLERLKAEDRRLKAERSGGAAAEEAARRHDAVAHTRKIEDGFTQDLARMGWYQQPSPEVRRQVEEKALAYVRGTYGEPAAERCRGLLEDRGAA